MKYLKEDGSLEVEHIIQLPLEECVSIIENLTQEQYRSFVSKLPLNEGHKPITIHEIVVDYGFDDARSGVDAEEFLNNWRKELEQQL